ncbi:MAG TPA: thioredoxin family protein [Candidatus Limiplasma sp.]|nr:thioredoxin family protein [Candidatus Limiplasma sp.]
MQTIQTVQELETLARTHDLLLVYFSGETCGVCRSLLPKVEKMLEAYPQIASARVEVGQAPELAASRQIFSVPAILLLIQGKETIRESGVLSLQALEQRIARYYAQFYSNP